MAGGEPSRAVECLMPVGEALQHAGRLLEPPALPAMDHGVDGVFGRLDIAVDAQLPGNAPVGGEQRLQRVAQRDQDHVVEQARA